MCVKGTFVCQCIHFTLHYISRLRDSYNYVVLCYCVIYPIVAVEANYDSRHNF